LFFRPWKSALTDRLGRAGKARPRVNAAHPKRIQPPSARQLSFDWIRRPEKRTIEARARLDKIRAASPSLTAALDLADEFKSLIPKQSSGTLQDWLTRAEASPCPKDRHFAEGIRRDESAVNAAVMLIFYSCASVFDVTPLLMGRESHLSQFHSATSLRNFPL
jgi:transposase